MTVNSTQGRAAAGRTLVLLCVAAILAIASFAAAADTARAEQAPVGETSSEEDDKGAFGDFTGPVDDLKDKGMTIVAALCGVGVLLGGLLLALGMTAGLKMLGVAAGAGAAVLLGNEIVRVFLP